MRTVLIWTCCLGVFAGCGAGSGPPPTPDKFEEINLGDVGEMYRLYCFANKKAPTKFDDFKTLQQSNPLGFEAVKSGKVVLLYGESTPDAELEGTAKTGSDQILAYQVDVPQSGGRVLMLDRSIKKMTADEFKAAPKAGKP
jgi:hypothetical protein